jgi:PAS domain S-box-containing protein
MTTKIAKSLTLQWMILPTLLATIPLIIAGLGIVEITHEGWKRSFIAMEGTVLIVGMLFSLFLTKKLTHPLKRLSKEMKEVAKGNWNTYIEPATKDEIGGLVESFNHMIQALKQSKEALREAEERYWRIFENSKDMVYVTSREGKFIDVNPAGVEMLGYENKEELCNIWVRDAYLNPEERKRFRDEISKEGFVKDFESKLKRKDGTPIDVLITASARKNDSGDILGYAGIIKNISVRKKMEEELIQRKMELEILYDMSGLINQSLNIDTVFHTALEKALSVTGFEMGSIYLLNEKGDTLERKSHIGLPPTVFEDGKVLKYGEGASGKAISSKQPVVAPIDEYLTYRKAPALIEEGIQTLVGFPLQAKGEVVGAIGLLSRSPRNLSQREINLLESIGNQIGVALENAKLFSNVAKAKSEWETTFDAVTDLIMIRDKDYRILRVNMATFIRMGLGAEDLIGRKCYKAFYHREMPCEDCNVTEALRTKKNVSGERKSKYLNGIFQYYTFPILDTQGEVTGVVDLAREITEEKRLEIEKEVVNNINKILASSSDVGQEMKGVHAELKRVLDSEKMTITLFDGEKEGFQYFGLGEEGEIEGFGKDAVFPKKGTVSGKVIDTGLPVIVKDIAECDAWIDHKLLLAEMRSSLVFPLEYKGKVLGTINFGSKKTNHFSERHFPFLRQVAMALSGSIENALLLNEIRESEEKYRIVVEGALDGVCVVSIDYQFKYVNERLAEIQGYSREELIGKDFRNYLDEESRRLLADREGQRKKGMKLSPHFELTILRKDGGVRNVEISARSIRDSKGNVNIIVILKDITEKKRMEEQLLQAEKLRAVGEMASGVAHDFNNALAGILGNTQLLLNSVKDEEWKESLQTIEKVAKDSAQTVRRLQDFTRRKIRQELYKLNVNSIVNDAMEITKPKWKDEAQVKGIQIEMVSHLEEIPSVAGTASELREVMANLIFNAIEAMPEGGKIEIRTFQRDEKVFIQISDTGMGMKEEVRKKIFEPFFTTKPFSHTGLGLSMSYGIIKRMIGEIDVESEVGKGTTFTLSLPISLEAKEEVTSFPSPEIQRTTGARILVIDDEESVRSVLSRILTRVKYQVNVAKSGEEGIRLFHEKEYDMVLTDLGMPGMSGWEVCREIKKIKPRIPVGLITGWGNEVGEEKMREVDLDFLISKPFDFNQILSTVAKTMESKGI